MKISTKHKTNKNGIPQFIEKGKVKNYATGIKRLREKHGMTTGSLANILDVSQRTVEGWECGRTPNIKSLILIHYAYGNTTF